MKMTNCLSLLRLTPLFLLFPSLWLLLFCYYCCDRYCVVVHSVNYCNNKTITTTAQLIVYHSKSTQKLKRAIFKTCFQFHFLHLTTLPRSSEPGGGNMSEWLIFQSQKIFRSQKNFHHKNISVPKKLSSQKIFRSPVQFPLQCSAKMASSDPSWIGCIIPLFNKGSVFKSRREVVKTLPAVDKKYLLWTKNVTCCGQKNTCCGQKKYLLWTSAHPAWEGWGALSIDFHQKSHKGEKTNIHLQLSAW